MAQILNKSIIDFVKTGQDAICLESSFVVKKGFCRIEQPQNYDSMIYRVFGRDIDCVAGLQIRSGLSTGRVVVMGYKYGKFILGLMPTRPDSGDNPCSVKHGLEKTLTELVSMVDKARWRRIVVPMLNWIDRESMTPDDMIHVYSKILDDRFVIANPSR